MDKKYIIFQSKRIYFLKILTSLYSVNPVYIFDKLRNLEEDYKRKAHQEITPLKNEFKNLLRSR